ncbi:MAG: YqgE/AlgH family protein, partial [Planctomycetota bacterium]
MSVEQPGLKRGTLLVAKPHLLDPNFMHTVVMLCEHSAEDGALGFVLNRPSENRLPEVLSGDHDFKGRSDRVFLGGPVGTDSLAILHREEGLIGSTPLYPGIYLGGDPSELGQRVQAKDTAVSDLRFLVGYSGWGKGQLEHEISENTWVLCPGQPEWVF